MTKNIPRKRKTAVIAIGGNSLIVNPNKQAIPDQYEAAVRTVKRIVDILELGWNIVITHGSGPQVGFVLRRSELASQEIAEVPMDYADADIQGAIGYMFQRSLHNEFIKRGIDKAPITVVTQVLVDPEDAAFSSPSKPIGPHLNEKIARQRAKTQGWVIKEDTGAKGSWRRIVPSPLPQKIIELKQIQDLIDLDYVVIACGGGGIPVVRNQKNYLEGIEAVIDKDLASGMLASEIGAELFIISTDVEQVSLNFGKANEKLLNRITLEEAISLYENNHFDRGSMGPKIKSMIDFLSKGGPKGIITNPENLVEALGENTGTIFES
ncbi:MAG: carbamate kinase [Pseudomonadota bacterium]|nr:carbamate kinase [Pseudomonadota bacterium]